MEVYVTHKRGLVSRQLLPSGPPLAVFCLYKM